MTTSEKRPCKRREEIFLEISELLTGFSSIELQGTGLVTTYYAELTRTLGSSYIDRFFLEIDEILNTGNPTEHRAKVDAEKVISNDFLGPIAITIVKLWYLATWVQLPKKWRENYGSTQYDYTRVISSLAYKEGLVWRVARSHPMGAKPPGFGSWSLKPV